MSRITGLIAQKKRTNARALTDVKRKIKVTEQKKAALERKQKAVATAQARLKTSQTRHKEVVDAIQEGERITREIRRKSILQRKMHIEIKRKEKNGERTKYQLARAEILGVEITKLEKAFQSWDKKVPGLKIDLKHYEIQIRQRRANLEKLLER